MIAGLRSGKTRDETPVPGPFGSDALYIGVAVPVVAVALALSNVALRMVAFRRISAWAHPPLRRRLPPAAAALRARRVIWLVDGVGRRLIPSTCLSRSCATVMILRRLGVDARLRIGIAREGAAIRAHAWVEHAGRPLHRADAADRFAALPV